MHIILSTLTAPHPYPDMVTRFQSVISEETKWQFKEKTGNSLPDIVIACVGGGSNAAGMFYHYIDHPKVRLIGVEAAGKGITTGESGATIALGREGVLHGARTILI